MKRLELFEFEDFPWLPDFVRSGVTNLIKVFHRMTGTPEVLHHLLLHSRAKYDFEQIVDLGSGSGGPMLAVAERLKASRTDRKMSLVLTDIHPDPSIVKAINRKHGANVQYAKDPLDARDMGSAPDGLKTMVGSFHHLNPVAARHVLLAAEKSRQPILIYELAQNTIPTLLWWLLLPLSLVILFLMAWGMTPFVRPLTFKQLLFTFIIPIIPIVYAWDGQASLMRTYTFEDIEILLGEQSEAEKYAWEYGAAKKVNGKEAGYYILGYPLGGNNQQESG